jgi:hypothetical protein
VRWLLFMVVCLPSLVQAADKIVVSDAIGDVAVTVYRDPYRETGPMSAGWPGGYALITETRTINVPQGDSVIRFENVAEGLLPETAIVTGLPSGVREKNRDARLISPAGLVDAYLKRRVTIRRTDPATGKAREEMAIIQSGPDGGVLLRTTQGVEALRCSGLPERMIYDGVPETLSAKPTLSILTRSNRAVTATIQLTYMSQGFDWSANYVGHIAPAGDKMGLFAWLTVANGGQQSFLNARLQVIAGKPNKRPNNPPPPPPVTALNLQCWPADITSTHPVKEFVPLPMPPGNDLSRYNAVGRNAAGSFETRKQRKRRERLERYMDSEDASEVIVTASRAGGRSVRRPKLRQVSPMSVMSADVMMPMPMAEAPPPPPPSPVSISITQGAKAGVEDLGDLKLYRVPMRVTVAAQSQKQVAMIEQPAAEIVRIYSVNAYAGGPQALPMPFLLRTKNVKEKGLGLPLPAGQVALFEKARNQSLLVGEQSLADHAIGEEIEFQIGKSPDVQWTLTRTEEAGGKQTWRAEITNARDVPIKAEIIVPFETAEKPKDLERRRGGWALPLDVPANDKASLNYTRKVN